MTGPAPAYGVQISVDCADPAAMTRFWSLALGCVEQPPPEGFADWAAFADAVGIPDDERNRFGSAVDPAGVGPRLLFQVVPEGKTAKNRMHLDVNVGAGLHGDDRRRAVRDHAGRLIAAGAQLVEEREDADSWWIVLHDIEGNEFCLQ